MSDSLEELVREIVREEVGAVLAQSQPDDWLTHPQAAEYLGISRGHLWNLRGVVPSQKPGGRRLYRRSELDDYVTARRS